MNKFKSKESQPQFDTCEGWLVQVYGRDRRLLCVLEPSHGWLFLLGCAAGLLLAVVWFNIARSNPVAEPLPAQEVPELRMD